MQSSPAKTLTLKLANRVASIMINNSLSNNASKTCLSKAHDDNVKKSLPHPMTEEQQKQNQKEINENKKKVKKENEEKNIIDTGNYNEYS